MIDESWYLKPPKIPVKLSVSGVVVSHLKNIISIGLLRQEGLPGYVLPEVKLKDNEKIDPQKARVEIASQIGIFNIDLVADLGSRERLDITKSSWIIIHYYLYLYRAKNRKLDNYMTGKVSWYDFENLPFIFWPDQRELLKENTKKIIELTNKYQ